jgi:hypothetical protein
MGALLTAGTAHGAVSDVAQVHSGKSAEQAQAQDIALQLTDPRYGQRQVVMPETMRELAKEPSTTGAPNAIQERQAAEVYGGLQKQPGINEGGLPAQEGVERVPPSGVPPGDTTGTARAEEARTNEVPLKPQEVTIKARTPAGEEIGLKMDAGEAQRRLTQRKTVLEALRDCLG